MHLGLHIKSSTIEDLLDADAIVLETGVKRYEDFDLEDLLYDPQYKIIIRENVEFYEPKPIFFVDLPDRKSKFRHFVEFLDYLLPWNASSSLYPISPFLLFLAWRVAVDLYSNL